MAMVEHGYLQQQNKRIFGLFWKVTSSPKKILDKTPNRSPMRILLDRLTAIFSRTCARPFAPLHPAEKPRVLSLCDPMELATLAGANATRQAQSYASSSSPQRRRGIMAGVRSTTIAVMRRRACLGVKADAGEGPNCSMPDVSLATGPTGWASGMRGEDGLLSIRIYSTSQNILKNGRLRFSSLVSAWRQK
jgi:hypothetical protein